MNAAGVKSALPTVGGTSGAMLSNIPSAVEKNKQWQRELLMERIRSHASQHKSFPELSKAMRMAMLEKRYALDAVEKSNLQKCLDSMQHCIKVTSRQGLVERLESLSRQLGLKFMDDTKVLFISTDMFFLEIVLDANGALTDVKVHHECKVEQQSCSELVDCLNRGDFADFTVQLEGLSSIYQLNAEPKVKTKAFDAMQAMETDLYNIFQMQNFSKDTQQVLADSVVGIVLKRRGGHPMRLTYFVSPYDLISLESKTMQPLTIDLIASKKLGLSVTVNLEASSANKLQILPTVTFAKDAQSGVEVPVFAPLTQLNSMLLPATFVLRLNKPLPVCYSTLRAMGLCAAATGSESGGGGGGGGGGLETQHKAPLVSNIMSLVIQTASEQQLKNSQKGLFVCLPDQTHCYFFTENKQLKSTLIHSVPFTEPAQVPKILDFLKKQALFYTLLSSCVRSQSKMGNDIDSTTILEVNAISFQQISVSLQHPYEESMATVEFDLRNGSVKCSIYSISNNYDLLSIKLTTIVQKCLSIPVTIRSLLKFWDQERMRMFQRSIGAGSGGAGGSSVGGGGCGAISGNLGNTVSGFGNFNLGVSPSDPGGGAGGSRGVGVGSNAGIGSIKLEPGIQRQHLQNTGNVAGFLKFKGQDVKKEDFHESPKSQTQTTGVLGATPVPMTQSTEASSLGFNQQHDLQTANASEIEIADKYKNIWKDKTPNLKSLSITPIGGGNGDGGSIAQQSALDVKRTGGIEIIPLTGQPSTGLSNTAVGNVNSAPAIATSTTITITPINSGGTNSSSNCSGSSGSSGSGSGKDKKSMVCGSAGVSLGSSSPATVAAIASPNKRPLESNEAQKEKKRKKKRDDSPMGPPEKVFSRQNSPAANSEATATVVARKFSSPSSSPKGASGGLLASSVAGSSLSTRPSPKHSPVYSSPKHNTASNSPKSPFGTHSPKHGSSGKPSMSTLKSATAASPKGDKSSSSVASSSGSGLPSGGSGGVGAPNLMRPHAVGGNVVTGGTSNSSAVAAAAAAAAAAMAALKNRGDKEKVGVSAATVSSAAVAAAAAVKSSMGVAAMQQLKSVAGLNHMAGTAATAGFGGGAGAGGSCELSAAMRKGVAAAVSLMTSTAATATTSTSLTTAAQQQAQLQQQQQQQQQLRKPQSVPAQHQHQQQLLRLQEQRLGSSTENSDVPQAANSSSCSSSSSGSGSSSEYMVKSSQEGLKLTINKTSNKGSLSSAPKLKANNGGSSLFSTSSFSPASAPSLSSLRKQHTGLKPGVNSGPASRKSNSSLSATSSNSAPSSSLSPIKSTKHVFQKSNSSGNLSAKLSNNSSSTLASATLGIMKSNSTSSFAEFRKSGKRSSSASTSPALPSTLTASSSSSLSSSSQPATRLDHQADMLKILQYASPTMAASMEGFMKGLNSKFQIPKLSHRNANPTNPTVSSSSLSSTTPSSSTPSSSSSSPAATTTTTTISQPQSVTGSVTASTSSLVSAPSAALATVVSAVAASVGSASVAQCMPSYSNDVFALVSQTQAQTQQLKPKDNKLRSPPPSYQATMAAVAAAAAATANVTPPAVSQSSVSAHVLKSPVTTSSLVRDLALQTTPAPSSTIVLAQSSSKTSVDLLASAKAAVDETLLPTLAGE